MASTAVSSAAAEESDQPFVLNGVIAELHVEMGKQNLLEKIDKHYKGKAVLTGAGAVVGDLFGQAASSAMVAMYDGEDTQNFACLVNDQIVVGQFGGAEFLKTKNAVKMVVTKEGDVLRAHAILDEKQGLLWIGHPWGAKAELTANYKIAWWGFLFQLIGMSSLGLIMDGLSDDTITLIAYSFFGGGAICFGIALWANRDMRTLSDPSTEMFRLLGFAEPERINLNSYRINLVELDDHLKNRTEGSPILSMSEFQTRDVYCYKRAIEDKKLALA